MDSTSIFILSKLHTEIQKKIVENINISFLYKIF